MSGASSVGSHHGEETDQSPQNFQFQKTGKAAPDAQLSTLDMATEVNRP